MARRTTTARSAAAARSAPQLWRSVTTPAITTVAQTMRHAISSNASKAWSSFQ
jgi:hypothetical protein